MLLRLHILRLASWLLVLCGVPVAGAQPANDHFKDRISLAGTNLTLRVTNTLATIEPGEPNHNYYGYGGRTTRSLWWTWTAQGNGHLFLTTEGSSVTGVLITVYTGKVISSLQRIGGVQVGYNGFPVSTGVTYQIVVSTPGDETGEMVWTLHHLPVPDNDAFAARRALTGTRLIFTGWNAGATREVGEPSFGQIISDRSVWYEWTAPQNGRAIIKAVGRNTAPAVAVFVGDTLSTLRFMANNWNSDTLVFEAAAGTRYTIGVDRREYEGSPFHCELRMSTLRLITPAPGASVATFDTVAMAVETSPLDGAIGQVDFLVDNQVVGSALAPPWQFHWPSPAAGLSQPTAFGVRARAVTTAGEITETPSHSFTVSGPAPSNDKFAEALALTGAKAEFLVANQFASSEPNELRHAGLGMSNSLWWTWTAPFDGRARLAFSRTNTAPDPPYSTIVAPGPHPCVGVYRGDSLASLTAVWSYPAPYPVPDGFAVQAGQRYWLAMDRTTVATESYLVALRAYRGQANDEFTNRQPLTGPVFTVSATNDSATMEPGEPNSHGAGRTLWWSWTAAASGVLRFPESDKTPGTLLTVHTGENVSLLSAVPFHNDGSGVALFTEPGKEYYLRLDSAGTQEGAVLRFKGSFDPVPTNDVFASRTALTGFPVELTWGNFYFTSTEAGEPMHRDSSLHPRTAWWSWTAPISAKVRISAIGYNTSVVVGAYTGDALNTLSRVPSAGMTAAEVTFDAVGGRTYQIAIAANYHPTLSTACLRITGAPKNDAFAARTDLGTNSVTLEGSIALATSEPGEPMHAGDAMGRTVWYAWTAPGNGALRLRAVGLDATTVFAAYRGESLAALTPVAPAMQNAYTGEHLFPVIAGEQYRIAVDCKGSSPGLLGPGDFTLTVDFSRLQITSPEHEAVFRAGRPLQVIVNVTDPPLKNWLGPAWVGVTGYFQRATSTPQPLDSAGALILSNQWPDIYTINAWATNQLGKREDAAPVWVLLTPSNDRFADRTLLTGLEVVVTNAANTALMEPEESAWEDEVAGSLWWTWTPPVSGRMAVGGDGSVRIFTGAQLGRLTPVKTGVTTAVFDAEAGVPYQIALGVRSFRDIPPVSLAVGPAPTNDHFAARTQLDGYSARTPFRTDGATSESGEPTHFSKGANATVWFSWTAPVAGELSVSLEESSFYARAAVYRGATLATLVKVGEAPLIISAREGEVFQIAVDGQQTPSRVGTPDQPPYLSPVFWRETGTGVLRLKLKGQVSNDAFANRIVVAGEKLTLATANWLATSESGEPKSQQVGFSLSLGPTYVNLQGTVWWSWTVPRTGIYRAEVFSPLFGASFQGFTGDMLTNLKPMFANHWASPSDVFYISAAAGTSYQLRLGSLDANRGEVEVRIQFVPPPPNDAFAERIVLNSFAPRVSGVLVGAPTRETGEPPQAASLGSLWYEWTAPRNGRAEITLGPVATTAIEVFRGSALTNLQVVSGSDAGGTAFRARSGERYCFAVYAPLSLSGTFDLSVDLYDSPPNDDFEGRIILEGFEVADTVILRGASAVTGSGADTWWKWVAPVSGRAKLWISGCSNAYQAILFRNSSIGLAGVGQSSGYPGEIEVIAGVEYVLQLSASPLDVAQVHLTLPPPRPLGATVHVTQSGASRVRLEGLPGQVFFIETSDDLKTWRPWETRMFHQSDLWLEDLSPPAAPARYYRIRPLR